MINRPLLACMHRLNSDTGLVGRALYRRGLIIEKRHLVGGDSVPDLENYQALIIFGGPQSANDIDPAICAEHQLVEMALKKDIPLLGICLGAQIIARVLGGQVRPHEEKNVEAGFYPIIPTDIGRSVFPKNLIAYQWHGEGITLPASVPLLASNNVFPVQAFRANDYGFGLQFHPEVNFAMMRRWLRRDKKEGRRLKEPNAKASWRHYPDYALHHRQMKSWLNQFLNQWLEKKNDFDNNK